MERTRLGSSDLEVSRVGLGCNNFGRRIDLAGTREVVDAAVAVGITFFDTADIYGFGESERYLGEALGSRRLEIAESEQIAHHEPAGVPGTFSSSRLARRCWTSTPQQ